MSTGPGHLLLQVLLKWNMQRGVPVIPKATSRDHLAENFVDMFTWRLTNQQKVRQAAAAACRNTRLDGIARVGSVGRQQEL